MRAQIDEMDLDLVTGGTVKLSESKNKIGFTTLGEAYPIKCTFAQARDLVVKLFALNPDLKEREFDQLVKDAFTDNGWI